MKESADRLYEVRAVRRALDILDVLQRAPAGVSLAEIARATGLPRSSAFRYLATLEGRGYVERNGTSSEYRLGLAFQPLRAHHLDVLKARSRTYLEELRDRFQETVNLGVLDGESVTYLEILESPQAVRFAARRGGRDPIHSTALGKALVALLADDEVRRLLGAARMERRTSRTIVDPEDFMREVAQVRAQGYAVDDRENQADGRCVAVAVPAGRVPAAISLSAPAVRLALARAEEVAPALRRAAERLTRELEEADA